MRNDHAALDAATSDDLDRSAGIEQRHEARVGHQADIDLTDAEERDLFGKCRRIAKASKSLSRGDGDRHDEAALDCGQSRRRIDNAERHMSADQVGNHRGHASIGHQLDPGIGHLIEHLGRQMHQRAVTAVADHKFVGLLCHRDDVAKRLPAQRI